LNINPLSPLPIVVALLLALATTHCLARRFAVKLPKGRVSTIDGLRGFLALAVFVYHACIWFFYLRTGQWYVDSSVYTHLGSTSVALFFMITAFLFFSKLLDAKNRPVDWLQLYLSRLFRLGPLYLTTIGAMLLIVAVLSDGQLREPLTVALLNVARWLAFTVPGIRDLNGIDQTWIIVAGVTWTLKYEWIFYLLLPLLACLMGAWPPAVFVLLGAMTALALNWLTLDYSIMSAFLGGMAAAALVRYERVRMIATAKASSLLAASCLAVVVIAFPTPHSALPLLLLTVMFTLVAAGNTLFGLLSSHTSRVLGELAYSIYLLHGLVLFLVFRFLLGFPDAGGLSALSHWLVVGLCTPVVIALSFLTFYAIELPAMRLVPGATSWIRSRCKSAGQAPVRQGGQA